MQNKKVRVRRAMAKIDAVRQKEETPEIDRNVNN